MKINDVIDRLIQLEVRPTLYKLGTFMNKYDGQYLLSDCSGLIKGILWGYPENGKYASNGVPDINADTMIEHCSYTSNDFSKIKDGAIVHMSGHIGVHIGDGVCIESSPRWENGIQRTFINGSGYKNTENLKTRNWERWGLFDWFDYDTTVENKPTNVTILGVVVNAPNGLRVRSKPNTSSKILRKLSNGTHVNITQTNGNWGYIGDGWVCMSYISTAVQQSGYKTGRYTVNTSALRVRVGPSTKYRQLSKSELTADGREHSNANGCLLYGTHVDVSAVIGNWGLIPSGYICLDYCRKGN